MDRVNTIRARLSHGKRANDVYTYQEGTCGEKVCPDKVDRSLREPFSLQIVAKDDPEESI